jgi:antitoxin HicB
MEKQAVTYTLEIEHHEDGYLAYFPALPGCHTWGRTYEAAVKHAEEALIGFLEALQMNGEDIPVKRPSCRAQKLDRAVMPPADKHDGGLRARVPR